MRAIVSVIGKDRTGIIATISGALYEMNSNILDISQTVMQSDIFTMVLLADLDGINVTYPEFKERLNSCAQELGMEINVQREEIFKSMHRI